MVLNVVRNSPTHLASLSVRLVGRDHKRNNARRISRSYLGPHLPAKTHLGRQRTNRVIKALASADDADGLLQLILTTSHSLSLEFVNEKSTYYLDNKGDAYDIEAGISITNKRRLGLAVFVKDACCIALPTDSIQVGAAAFKMG